MATSSSTFTRFLLGTCAFLLILIYNNAAFAVPAFSRQTGMECAACHVGSFGPQLTNFGRQFKLNGYVWGEVKSLTKGLSAMAYGGFEHTNTDLRKGIELTGNQERFGTNNDFTIDQASLFYAGKLTSNIGMMAQFTYSSPRESYSWDNLDLRFADNTTVSGKSLVYGVSVNNNPSVQDVWQSTPTWRFPYLASGLAPTPAASPYIENLAQKVLGTGAYALFNDWVYAELSGYSSLSDDFQRQVGIQDSEISDHLSGLAPYWRLAIQHEFGQNYASFGTYGLDANRFPGNDRTSGTDNMLDYALDATYQYHTDDGKHFVSVYGSLLRELQKLDATFAEGGSSNAQNHLTEARINASYYFNNEYGITLGRFMIDGSADSLLYSSPTNSKPDSAGWTIQLDFTPFGTAKSPLYPNFNQRFFIQYTAYDKFDGESHNYDGTGRNASDNDTLYIGDWIAF